MPLYRLLRERVFEPDVIAVMADAYERAITTLGLKGRDDAATRLVAETVIQLVETGVRDKNELYRRTLIAFAPRPPPSDKSNAA